MSSEEPAEGAIVTFHERLVLVEARVVAPMVGQETVGRIEAGGRDPGP